MERADDRLECRTSIKNTIALILLCPLIAFFAHAGVVTGLFKPFIGWSLIALSGPAAVYWLIELFRRGPQVIIDEVGIEDRRSGVGIIPWEQIVDIEVRTVLDSRPFMNIEVADEALLLAPLSRSRRLWLRSRRFFCRSPFAIRFVNLTPGLDDAMSFILARGYYASGT